jgi:hypothetical protein
VSIFLYPDYVSIQTRTNPPDHISPEFLQQLGDDKDNPVVFHAEKVFLLGAMTLCSSKADGI